MRLSVSIVGVSSTQNGSKVIVYYYRALIRLITEYFITIVDIEMTQIET